MNVTVYSKPTCVQCTATKKALDKSGVPFVEKMIDDDPSVKEMLIRSNRLQMPYVRVEFNDGSLEEWSGFKPDKVKALKKSL